MVIRRIGVLSLTKLLAVLYAAFGAIAGLIFGLASLAGAAFGAQDETGLLALMFGAGAIVVLPVFYGLFGALTGLLTGALYNLLAGLIGGLELTVE